MPQLDQQTIIIIVIAAVVLIALGVAIALLLRRRRDRRNRRATLRQQFGPEYDRAVADSGEREAVEELSDRTERHSALSLRELDEAERDQVRSRMAVLQYSFVEEPSETLLELQRVVTEVLEVKGYPIVSDRAEGLRMLSVDHPMLTQPVRALLQGEYGGDLGDQRHLFLDVRTAMREIGGVSYDVTDTADDSRRAGGAAPATVRSATADDEPQPERNPT